MITRFCTSVEDTMALGEHLAQFVTLDDCIVLSGDLGAGKTQFAKGFAAGPGVDDDIASPTFTILLEYVGDEMPLLHFDLYRLETERELEDIDFAGMLESGAVSLVEWGDKFPDALPEERLDVFIYVVEDGTRRVEVHGRGQRGLELEQMF